MSDHFFVLGNKHKMPSLDPLHDHTPRQTEKTILRCATDRGETLSACADGFLDEPEIQPRSNYENDGETETPNPPKGEAMEDLRKSLDVLSDLMIGPIQRRNDARADELLSLIEQHKVENDRNMDALTKQMARLTLKLHDKTKLAVLELDRRVDGLETTLSASNREIREKMTADLLELASLMDDKLKSISESIDAKIAKMASGINGEVHRTILALGRAISGIANSA